MIYHILITAFMLGAGGFSIVVIFGTLKRHSDDLDFLIEVYHESKARQDQLENSPQSKNSLDCNG